MIKIYGYIYKTVNLINGKFYIGQHKSPIFDNKYYGSGKIIKLALKKYGAKNFEIIVLEECESKESLDNQEKFWINFYKKSSSKLCYNLAKGGNGGDVFYYQSPEQKQKFIDKMTKINKQRCSSAEFREKISKATYERYKDPAARKEQSEKAKNIWSSDELRMKQSKKLKKHYKLYSHDCSFNKIKCCFELDGLKLYFDSIAELRAFLKEKYSYNPDRRTFQRLMYEGKQGKPFVPFHKNKFKKLIGMKIYKIDDDVETNRDECNGVGAEISAASKDEAR